MNSVSSDVTISCKVSLHLQPEGPEQDLAGRKHQLCGDDDRLTCWFIFFIRATSFVWEEGSPVEEKLNSNKVITLSKILY